MTAAPAGGERVIAVVPARWGSTRFPGKALALLEGTPVIVQCGQNAGFKMTGEQLEAAITPRTRWVMLNSPNNPSGAIFTREEFAALGKVLERHPELLSEIRAS